MGNIGRTLLLRHAERLVTTDEKGAVLHDAGLSAVDGVVRDIGATAELLSKADEVIDARGMVVLPGLVNTHHHLFQRRELAGAQCDPVAALVLCMVLYVDLAVIEGTVRVRGGELLGFDWSGTVREHNRHARHLLQ
jgi:imidazolonepropionase-like amidohydrolase